MTSDAGKYDKIIYDTAISEGLRPFLAECMVAQAKHESAQYQSDVFKRCNNLYGYKYVGQKLAKACSGSPEGDKYAGYDSVADSAREIARWIQRRADQFKDVNTTDEYAVVLENNGYFGDNLSTYQKALRSFWSPIKGAMNTAVTKYPTETILTGVTFFSLLSFYIYRATRKK